MMNIDEARQFILHHQDAERKAHPGHAKWLQAVEVVEQFKEAKQHEWTKPSGPAALDNPRFGRMRR